MEPLIILSLIVLNAVLAKIRMEVRVLECIAGTVVEDSGATPFLVIFDICRMGLLTKTLIYILLSVADLHPLCHIYCKTASASSDIDWTKSVHEIDLQLYRKYGSIKNVG